MRIAQVSPLYESVPPQLYGGTERVVFNLSEALIRMGHEVTVFASGDSICSGRLIPACRQALRLGEVREKLAPHMYMFERVRAMADEFDLIHFHTEYIHFGLARSLGIPVVSTMHGRLDLPEYADLFFEFRDQPLVSISMNQRSPLPHQNWISTVHHGIPKDAISYRAKSDGYLAFLGRISPEKGVAQAIEIAQKSGRRLRIAAKVDRADWDYYLSIRRNLEMPGIEFIGEIGDREKAAFLGGADAVLFPVQWPEPFGLVMIESLAAGSPVVAFRSGSVPEVIRHGETGFIVDSVDEACRAVRDIVEFGAISRRACRRDFELRFVVERMAADYVDIYRSVINEDLRNGGSRISARREEIDHLWRGGLV